MQRFNLWIWMVVAGLILVVAGCATQQQPTEGALNLTGAGATFPYPLYSKWFSEYSQANPQVRINYQSIGSGGGIQQLKAGTVDFGASDVPLTAAETQEMPRPVVQIPTVAGAVVVAYNLPELSQRLRLSGDVLADIYLGNIKSWNDARLAALNPGVKLPNAAIAVVHRSDGSGTTNLFTNYLAAVSPAWQSKVGSGKAVNWPAGIGAKGNEGVSGTVKQTPGALGYLELAYAVQNKLSYAALRNQAGQFVEPAVETTTAVATGSASNLQQDATASIINAPGEHAYPIAGFTYILLYKEQQDGRKGAALVEFLNWAIHDGQKYAADLHYAPLPAEVVKLNETALRGVTY